MNFGVYPESPRPWLQPLNQALLKGPAWDLKELQQAFICGNFFFLKSFVFKIVEQFFFYVVFFLLFSRPWVQPLNKALLKGRMWDLKELQFICGDFFFPFYLLFSKVLSRFFSMSFFFFFFFLSSVFPFFFNALGSAFEQRPC